MKLSTPRLSLQTLQPTDWGIFYQVHTDAISQQWISEIPTESEILQRFNERLAPWRVTSYHMLSLVIRDRESQQPLGLIGCNAEWEPHRQAEVGYMLLSAFFGRGYGSEALAAVCDFLFDECDFWKLKALVIEGNTASRRVLEKNGFQLEGLLRDNYRLREAWVNDWLFGRLKRDK